LGRPTNTLEAGIQQAILRGDAAELETLLGEANLSANDSAIAQRALSAMEKLGATDARMLAQRYGIDFANKIGHVLGESGHNLGGLIQRFGSAERAFVQIQNGVDSLSLSAGQFETTIAVGGVNVTVRGIVLDGVARISTAFVP
jgi:filamentous hemagglutinin